MELAGTILETVTQVGEDLCVSTQDWSSCKITFLGRLIQTNARHAAQVHHKRIDSVIQNDDEALINLDYGLWLRVSETKASDLDASRKELFIGRPLSLLVGECIDKLDTDSEDPFCHICHINLVFRSGSTLWGHLQSSPHSQTQLLRAGMLVSSISENEDSYELTIDQQIKLVFPISFAFLPDDDGCSHCGSYTIAGPGGAGGGFIVDFGTHFE